MKDTPVRSENRTGVTDCSETNSLSGPQRAEPRLNILLQSAPVRSPHGFETFPLLHKNLRTGQFRPWHAASKNACGSTALSILTDENTTGCRFISLQQFCIQRIPRRKFPPSDAWLRYVRSMPSIPQRYIVVLQSPVPARAGCHATWPDIPGSSRPWRAGR